MCQMCQLFKIKDKDKWIFIVLQIAMPIAKNPRFFRPG
jgi:hypothetical protein